MFLRLMMTLVCSWPVIEGAKSTLMMYVLFPVLFYYTTKTTWMAGWLERETKDGDRCLGVSVLLYYSILYMRFASFLFLFYFLFILLSYSWAVLVQFYSILFCYVET